MATQVITLVRRALRALGTSCTLQLITPLWWAHALEEAAWLTCWWRL